MLSRLITSALPRTWLLIRGGQAAPSIDR
jgi:hypothetical protein